MMHTCCLISAGSGYCVLSVPHSVLCLCVFFFFFQAEDGIRDLVRSRGLGDVYKRQAEKSALERFGGALVNLRGKAPSDAKDRLLLAYEAFYLSLIHI